MIVKQLLFDRVRNEYVSENLVESHGSVELKNVRSWLIQTFGPMLDIAFTVDEQGERIAIGWTFDLPPEMPSQRSRSDFEIVMIPMITQAGDGPLVSAFEWLAKERRRFEKMAADGIVDELTIHEIPQEPWQPPNDQ